MSDSTTRSRPIRKAVGIAATTACVVGLSMFGASGAQAATHVAYSGSVPSWAKASNDAGAAAADTTVEGEIFLPLTNPGGAEKLATAVSTPGDPRYKKGLSASAWISKFAPSQASLTTVLNYLAGEGATNVVVPKSRQFVDFRIPVSGTAAAFGTTMRKYSVQGKTLLAPSKAATLPAAVASVVSGVVLDQSRLLTHPDNVGQGSSTTQASKSAKKSTTSKVGTTLPIACSTYYRQNQQKLPAAYGKTIFNTAICGYTPTQVRSAYGLAALNKAGFNGSGQTVAIIDAYASPSIVQDTNTFSSQNGLPALTSKTFQQLGATPAQFTDETACAGPADWQGEETLDVQAVHGVAPGAKILYVGGSNCGGGLDVAMSTILDGKLSTIVSNSYGNTGENVSENGLQGEVNLQLQAAGEGIGLYYSSGDSGDEVANQGYASPDFPASSPWVTAVGGTSIGIDKSGNKTLETGWGDDRQTIVQSATGALSYGGALPGDFYAGAGGGVSGIFAQPAYQKGVVPSALATGKRVVPDVAAIADPYTGYAIGISPITDNDTLAVGPYVSETYGGTSLASPVTAAIMSIVQETAHTTLGFANPTLYAAYKAAPQAFNDVKPLPATTALAFTSPTSGISRLVTLDHDSSLVTTKGYDDVTGLGAVSFGLLSNIGRGRY